MKKLGAMLLSASLLLSNVMSAGAVFVDAGTSMTFTTQLNMSIDAVTAPDVDFVYYLTAGEAAEANDDHDMYLEGIMTGITDGYSGSVTQIENEDTLSITASFTTDDIFGTSVGDTSRYFEKELTIDFTGVEFAGAGIYHYTLKAQETDVAGVYMDRDLVRDICVYVVADGGDSYEIDTIIMFTEGVDHDDTDDYSSYKSGGYAHSYAMNVPTDPTEPTNPEDPEPEDPGESQLENFVVEAYVMGTMADSTKLFTYTLTPGDTTEGSSGTETGIPDGTIFKVGINTSSTAGYIKYDANSGMLYEVTITSDGTVYEPTVKTDATFMLSATDIFTIYSVVDGMQFTVTITDEDGYTMDARKLGGDDWEIPTADVLEFTNTVVFENLTDGSYAGDDEGIDFLTYANVGIPEAGVILQFAPFIILGLAGLGFITFRVYKFSAKKQ